MIIRVLRISIIKSIYKILKSTSSRKLYEIFRSSKAERERGAKHYITIFLSSNIMHNSMHNWLLSMCSSLCAVEKGLTTKSTLLLHVSAARFALYRRNLSQNCDRQDVFDIAKGRHSVPDRTAIHAMVPKSQLQKEYNRR